MQFLHCQALEVHLKAVLVSSQLQKKKERKKQASEVRDKVKKMLPFEI